MIYTVYLAEKSGMIKITSTIFLDEAEIKLTFIRAPGPGGQNVNKVATAVQLRFDVMHSPSLPESVRARFASLFQSRLTSQGELIIKASSFRTQERNKQDAIERLKFYLLRAAIPPKKRKKTKPTLSSIENRLERKKLRGKTKLLRRSRINKDD